MTGSSRRNTIPIAKSPWDVLLLFWDDRGDPVAVPAAGREGRGGLRHAARSGPGADPLERATEPWIGESKSRMTRDEQRPTWVAPKHLRQEIRNIFAYEHLEDTQNIQFLWQLIRNRLRNGRWTRGRAGCSNRRSEHRPHLRQGRAFPIISARSAMPALPVLLRTGDRVRHPWPGAPRAAT